MTASDHREPRAFGAPDAVQWHEGMLLAPQHFQLQARRTEAVLNAQMRAAVPFFWGVLALQIDVPALLAGRFRLTALHALMPDGLIVSHQEDGSGARADPVAAALDFDLNALDRDLSASPVAIHLAVAPWSDGAAAKGERRRFWSCEGPPAADENTGDNPVPAPRLRPAPRLMATDGPLTAPSGGWTSTPLAVVAERDGRLQLLDYAPPLLRAMRGGGLHDEATRIALALRARAAALADRLRDPAAAGDGASAEAGQTAAALRAVAAPLPRLEALLRDETASPYALYLSLCDVLGAIAGVAPDLAPPTAPEYRHADALPAFRSLSAMILPAVASLRAGPRLLPFERREDGAFSLAAAAALSDPFHLLVRPAPGGGAAAVRAWADAAIIATEDAMQKARLERTRGAARRLLDSPAELDVAAPGAVAVAVMRVPPHVTPGEALLIRHPDGPDARGAPVEVALVLPAETDAPPVGTAAGRAAADTGQDR